MKKTKTVTKKSKKYNTQNLRPFTKGDPRINRKGRPKQMPAMKALFDALLAPGEGEDITKSRIAQVVEAMISETKNKKRGNQRVAAGKEILDRVFGKVKSESEQAPPPPPVQWNETKTYTKR